MEEKLVQKSEKWFQGLSSGVFSGEFEALTLAGLQIVEARESCIRCHFIVPLRVTDEDGNWQVGAMATLIDEVGAAAVYSLVGLVNLSVDFNISFYSTAKIQEEIEIVAEVVGDRGKLTSVQVEVRRKGNGELIAFGKQWMASINISSSRRLRKSKL